MANRANWYDNWSTGVLLGMARKTYQLSVRSALTQAGYGDLPRNGPFVVGGIARTGNPLSEIITGLGASKQAAGQLVDALVARGYLERTVDEGDRRRLTITLTERGQGAAAVVRSAVEKVDARVRDKVGAKQFALTMATLAALIEEHPSAGDGEGDS